MSLSTLKRESMSLTKRGFTVSFYLVEKEAEKLLRFSQCKRTIPVSIVSSLKQNSTSLILRGVIESDAKVLLFLWLSTE